MRVHTKAIVLATDVAIIMYIVMLYTATHPHAMVYLAYYLRMALWRVNMGVKYALAPVWMREAMRVRGYVK